ncbi:MAG: LPS translocon maturation chaperone LptM [Alphaproteobacteria bacterium]
MKKVIICFLMLSVVALAGCGKKSPLEHPTPGFPRNYPVY